MKKRETVSIHTVYCSLKLFVAIIAVIMLAKSLANKSPELYYTVFVFVADKVLDTFFSKDNYGSFEYRQWGIVNGICGSIGCLMSIGVMIWSLDGAKVSSCATLIIHIFLGACIASLLARDTIQAIYYPLKRQKVREGIVQNEKKRRAHYE